jgi:hypothetical protein
MFSLRPAATTMSCSRLRDASSGLLTLAAKVAVPREKRAITVSPDGLHAYIGTQFPVGIERLVLAPKGWKTEGWNEIVECGVWTDPLPLAS